jgi:Leucine-rich repeat (LRR) protein
MRSSTALILLLLSSTLLSQTDDDTWCLEDFRKHYENYKIDTLSTLWIKSSCVSYFPDEVFEMKNLEGIFIDFQTLEPRTIPPQIGKLTKLRAISLVKANIVSIAPEFWNLTNLTSIQIDGNMNELPKEIGNLKNLRYLELKLNLTYLPEELQNLKQLRTLKLKNTKIPVEQIERLRAKLPHCTILI